VSEGAAKRRNIEEKTRAKIGEEEERKKREEVERKKREEAMPTAVTQRKL
jgi:hypothetical protein